MSTPKGPFDRRIVRKRLLWPRRIDGRWKLPLQRLDIVQIARALKITHSTPQPRRPMLSFVRSFHPRTGPRPDPPRFAWQTVGLAPSPEHARQTRLIAVFLWLPRRFRREVGWRWGRTLIVQVAREVDGELMWLDSCFESRTCGEPRPW